MNKYLKLFFRIFDAGCIVVIVVFTIYSLLEEVVGYRNMVDLLSSLNIPFNYHWAFGITFLCTVLIVVSKLIQRKMNK